VVTRSTTPAIQSLKEVMSVGAVEFTAAHAAVLEISCRCRTGMDLSGRASR
jgi:hypothetical protein